jgi:hypothetical protein
MGVVGGGGGLLFGLRIDHILHAIIGTPTRDGTSSPSRTVASLQQVALHIDVHAHMHRCLIHMPHCSR